MEELEANGSRRGERQVLSYWKDGGASRDRTDDLIVANDVVLRNSALIPQDLRTKRPLRTAINWNTIGT